MKRIFLALALTIFLAVGFATHAQILPATGTQAVEQSAEIAVPEELSAEMVRELVARLSDAEVRQLLLDRLEAAASQQPASGVVAAASFRAFLKNSFGGVYTSVIDAVVRLPSVGSGLAEVFSTFVERRGASGTATFLSGLIAGVVAGLIAHFLVLRSPLRRYFRRPHEDATLSETLRLLGARLGVDLLAIFMFFVVSFFVHSFFLSPADVPFTRLFLPNLVVVPLLISAASRFLISSEWPEARLLHTDDETARYLYRNQIGIALLAGFSIFIVQFSAMNGVPMGDTRLGFWLNLAFFLWLGVVIFQFHDGITQMLIGRDGDVTPTEARIARIFPLFYIGVIVFLWFLVEALASQKMYHLLRGGPHFYTLLIIAFVPVLDVTIRELVRRLVPPMQGEGELAARAYHSTKRSYIRIGRVIVFTGMIVLIAGQWNISVATLATKGLGAQFVARIFEALVVTAIGYLVWEISTLWFNRKLAAEQTASGFDLSANEPGGGEGGGQGGSRLSTVLPIIRLAVQVMIVTATALTALSTLGVDITPLLAGAGIVGIAIGFGAQTLVRDVVSGLFFLIDDAFRVGEYLVIDNTVGTVEKLNIRSLQLRHHTGPIHTIPYGEIPKVTNNSRDWVIMKLKFTFPFETDPNKIKKIFKKIGQDILEAEYAGDLIQTFKSQGVYDVDDVGIVIRGKFMAKPGTQWIIRKDIYNRVQKALDEAGIQFARKEVRVQIPGLGAQQQPAGPQKEATTAAASEVAENVEPAKP